MPFCSFSFASFFISFLSRSVTSVGLLRLLLVAFFGRLDIFCRNLVLVGDGGLEARCLRPPLKPSSNLGVWKKKLSLPLLLLPLLPILEYILFVGVGKIV